MSNKDNDISILVGMLIQYLARCHFTGESGPGLSNAQWSALRFFRHANRMSRTVSSFAEFHSTTLGTASKTINSLVERNLLVRSKDEHDRRRVIIDLSEKARAALEDDPFRILFDRISSLSNDRQATLESTLRQISAGMHEDSPTHCPGTCGNCGYLRERFDTGQISADFFCTRLGLPLSDPDIRRFCMHHSARTSAAE